MEKQKLEIIIISLSVVVFLVFLSSTITRKTRKAPKETPITETIPSKTYKPVTPEELQWGRDPFILYQYKSARTEEGLLLTAVIWDEEKPLAVINDEVVGIGQEIGGYRVIKINKNSAVLQKEEGQKITLELYK